VLISSVYGLCVRCERLSNTTPIYLGSGDFIPFSDVNIIVSKAVINAINFQTLLKIYLCKKQWKSEKKIYRCQKTTELKM